MIESKFDIRSRIRNLKSMLTEIDRISAADAVFARLEQSAAFQLADKILMYHSLPDELDTRRFLDKWKNQKRFFLPRVNGAELELLPYDESRLEIGSFHIEEPTGSDTHPVEEIEVIIVPGVAFDKKGNRIGRGKGFYDRLLKTAKAMKIGIGYHFQLFDELPSDQHDVGMDMIITEETTIILKR